MFGAAAVCVSPLLFRSGSGFRSVSLYVTVSGRLDIGDFKHKKQAGFAIIELLYLWQISFASASTIKVPIQCRQVLLHTLEHEDKVIRFTSFNMPASILPRPSLHLYLVFDFSLEYIPPSPFEELSLLEKKKSLASVRPRCRLYYRIL